MSKREPTFQIKITLKLSVLARLQRKAENENITVVEGIRQIVEEYVANHPSEFQ